MNKLKQLKMAKDIIIGCILLLTTSLVAQARDAKQSKTVNQNSNLHDSSERDKTVTQPTASVSKAAIIHDTHTSKPTIKPPEVRRINRQAQLPSIINAYNYLYSRQNWNNDNHKPPSPFGTTNFNEFALQGNLYYLKPNTDRLPDFSTMTPAGTIYIPKLDIPKRTFTTGFPGVDKRFEWFGIRYIGGFKIEQGGQYKFRLVSDDGAKLWINNKLIINNDGVHSPASKSATVDLSAGQHLIQVDYFQGPRIWIALQLYVTEPGGREKIFNPDFSSNKAVIGVITGGADGNSTHKFSLKFIRPAQAKP